MDYLTEIHSHQVESGNTINHFHVNLHPNYRTPTFRDQQLNTNFFVLKLFGCFQDIPAKVPGYPAKELVSLGFEGHTGLFGPHPSRGRPHPTRRSPDQKVWVWVPFLPWTFWNWGMLSNIDTPDLCLGHVKQQCLATREDLGISRTPTQETQILQISKCQTTKLSLENARLFKKEPASQITGVFGWPHATTIGILQRKSMSSKKGSDFNYFSACCAIA